MNTIQLLGNMTRNIEKKTSKNGVEFYTFTVADNQRDKSCTFWNCICFEKLSDKFVSFLTKGSAVVVTGEVSTPKTYEKKDGSHAVDISVTVKEVRFSPFKSAAKPEDAVPQAHPVEKDPNMPF